MTVATETTRAPSGRISVLLTGFKNLTIGSLLCTTPFTAVIVLGWMLRHMRSVTDRRLGGTSAGQRYSVRTNWLLGHTGSGRVARCFGGLWLNVSIGVSGFVTLAIATLPFSGLWLLSWWAGWENSFNKGYEQSWVGASLGLAGVVIGLFIMPLLPMAVAHMASERRWSALFEISRIRRLVGLASWHYVILSLLLVLGAVPVFAFRLFPVFVEHIIPGFTDLSADAVSDIAGMLAVLKGLYVFVAMVLLRGWSARVYSAAVLQAGAGRRAGKLGRFSRMVLLPVIWFGLVAQIYVGQFLNHNWVFWTNHPFLLLPWLA